MSITGNVFLDFILSLTTTAILIIWYAEAETSKFQPNEKEGPSLFVGGKDKPKYWWVTGLSTIVGVAVLAWGIMIPNGIKSLGSLFNLLRELL